MSDIVSHGCCLIGHPFRYFLWKNKILEMVLAAAMSIALSEGISVRLKKCEVAGAQEIVDYGDNYSYFIHYHCLAAQPVSAIYMCSDVPFFLNSLFHYLRTLHYVWYV